MSYEQELSPLGRKVSDVLKNIVRRAVNSAGETITHQIDVPEDFVKVSEPQNFSCLTENVRDINDSQLFYGQNSSYYFNQEECYLWSNDETTFIGVRSISQNTRDFIEIFSEFIKVMNEYYAAARVVILLMNDKDEIVKALSQNNSDKSLKEFQPKKLQTEDVSVKTLIDEEKKNLTITQYEQEIERLCQEISAFERDWDSAKNRYNVATDRSFGEWLQRFLIFAEKNSNDRKIQRLHDDLFAVLAPMGIKVYDDAALKEKRLKADGTPDVPVKEYLIDNRQGTSYNRVSRPAIYSDEQILARGEIS